MLQRGRDPEELRAELEAGVHRKRKKKVVGLEARVAAAWNQKTAHGNWERLTPQWQAYILNTIRAVMPEG